MDQNKKPLNKKLIAGVVALIAVIAILLGVYLNNRQPATSGSKTITVSVFDTVGSTEASNTAVRFCTSWATRDEDVDALLADIASL